MTQIDSLGRSPGSQRTLSSRLGIKAFLVFVLTPLIIGVAFKLRSAKLPAGETERSVRMGSDAVNTSDMADVLLSSFDEIERRRVKAQGRAIKEIKAVKIMAEKAVALRAELAARKMVSARFVGDLAFELSPSFGDNHNRSWKLFEDELDDTGEAVVGAYNAFARIQARFEQNLQRDQSEYRITSKPRLVASAPKPDLTKRRPKVEQTGIKKKDYDASRD